MEDFDALQSKVVDYGPAQKGLMQVMLGSGVLIREEFVDKYVKCLNAYEPKREDGGWILPEEKEKVVEVCRNLIRNINTNIAPVHMRLVLTADEYDDDHEFVVLISELLPKKDLFPFSEFTQDELALFRRWLDVMAGEGGGEIERHAALAIAERNFPKISAIRADQIVDRMVQLKWLAEVNNNDNQLRLGVRTLTELESFLTTTYNLGKCVLCKHPLFALLKVVKCNDCDAQFHRQCAKRLFLSMGEKRKLECPEKKNDGTSCTGTLMAPINAWRGHSASEVSKGLANAGKGGKSASGKERKKSNSSSTVTVSADPMTLRARVANLNLNNKASNPSSEASSSSKDSRK